MLKESYDHLMAQGNYKICFYIDPTGDKARDLMDYIVAQQNAFVITEKDLKKPNSKSVYRFHAMKKSHYESSSDLALFDMMTVSDQGRWPWYFMTDLKNGVYEYGWGCHNTIKYRFKYNVVVLFTKEENVRMHLHSIPRYCIHKL